MKRDLVSWDGASSIVPLASAKRTRTERLGLHAWHPYYGGYSEAFVNSALTFLGLRPGQVLLDPWAGSGTTSFVAARRGIDSTSVELNPVMASFAAAKSPRVAEQELQVAQFFADLSTELLSHFAPATNGRSAFFSPRVGRLFRAFFELVECSSMAPPDTTGRLDPISSFKAAVAFRVLRSSLKLAHVSNPSWCSAGVISNFTADTLVRSLQHAARGMLAELISSYSSGRSVNPRVFVADSRSLPLPSESIDCIITSPPYLTRLDYAVSTSPELDALGIELHSLREQLMGGTVIRRRAGRINRSELETYSSQLRAFIGRVAGHPSKAAISYYLKNFIQYFSDAYEVMTELFRVLNRSGSALLVLQNSYFKDVLCDLSLIYKELSTSIGFSAEIVRREPVRIALANVNVRSQVHGDKAYYEDVLLLTKP